MIRLTVNPILFVRKVFIGKILHPSPIESNYIWIRRNFRIGCIESRLGGSSRTAGSERSAKHLLAGGSGAAAGRLDGHAELAVSIQRQRGIDHHGLVAPAID